VGGRQFAQSVAEAFFVRGPFAREENEAVEHHAGAEDGDVLYRFFEDDVEVAVHLRGVCDPPEIDPVGVDLGLSC
jgi:hypothetical protein